MRFHFKVIRKSLYSHIFVFVLPSLQSFKMISDKIEWARVSGRFARRSIRQMAIRPEYVDSPDLYLSFFKPKKKEY